MTARDWNFRWHTEGVFTLTRPTAAAIERQIAAAVGLPSAAPPLLSLQDGLDQSRRLPFCFAHDHQRAHVGKGHAVFVAAKQAFERWAMFDLGWVRVVNPEARIALGQIVAVEAHTLGLWTLNLSRIMDAIDTPVKFGFLYATTKMHVEEGEERFLLEFNPKTGDVWYELEAVSRPRNPLARLGFPATRAFQHKFARDSHRRMHEEALAPRDRS
jgi:uncharacterized protein (UPF0548 family)